MKMNKEVVMVRLSDIIPNRFQPRLTFDEEALNELASSIKEHGIIQPLILRDLGNKYEIIAGERRYKASTLAGLTEVPAIVGTMDDQTSAELALIENIQRKDLTAIEEAKSYKKILEMGNFTQEELAKRMGKSQSTIANKMRLLALTNEVQVALMNNLISERHARCLLQVKDEAKQKEVLNKIIAERMNVRATDDYIKNELGITKEDVSEPTIDPIPDIKLAPEVESEPENIEEKTNGNPNVYTQSNNNDFVDISSLNEESVSTIAIDETPEVTESPPEETSTEIPEIALEPEQEEIEEEEESNMEEQLPEESVSQPVDPMTKIKLATAIRLAKDTVEDIKTAGYNVTMEEVDAGNKYQIIINVDK